MPTGAGTYRLTVSYLGYRPLDTVAAPGAGLVIALQPRSLALSEVVVWATEGKRNPSSSLIGKEALVHVQPSSFADVMQLLPGHLIKDAKLESATFVDMRQAGSDVNTSLGTAFLIDDAPLSVDGHLQDVYKPDDVLLSRTVTSRGVDMRKISTDRIEQVEVIRGIPSAEYGNLTSGVVKIETTLGKTPWESRAKIDLTNKLFSVGKGFALPGSSGTLNADVDYLDYHPDPRNVLTSYRRITFSSRYKNRLEVTDKSSLLLKAGLSYTGSFDNEKKDPEQMQGEESFSTAYNSVALSSSGELKLRQSFVSEVKYVASASYTSDALRRTRTVVSGNMPLPSATRSEERYAAYLPAVYNATLRVDDRPLSLSANVQARATPSLGILRQRLLLGAEWRREANVGQGELYDLTRPPYPGRSSTRPRPYSDVPAMQQLALYAEDEATLTLSAWRLSLRTGLRATTLPGQPRAYQMAGQWFAEPRVTAEVFLPKFSLLERQGTLSLNAGYGKHYKLPTQALLYPSNVYFDYIQLNYYSQQEALRTLHVQTWVEDPASYGIQPALNVKYEVGARAELGNAEASITVFDERMDNGFSSAATPVLHTFKNYDESAVPPESITTAPKVEDFPCVDESFTATYSKAYNTAQVHKKGVEYQLTLGRIRAVYTSIRLAGAWLQTSYRSAGLRYSKPTVVINGRQYPYTGEYTWNNSDKIRQQLNTNLYFETHIPALRMIFTTSVQAVWLTTTDHYRNNGKPVGYIDDAGSYYEFTESDAQKDIMQHLIEIYNVRYFDRDKIPLEATLNLRLTKEIGRALRASFYVNRLLGYTPDYISKYGTTVVRITQPSFGAEVSVKIG
jgi:outer membrane receptor for ferrienterochelin and colicin